MKKQNLVDKYLYAYDTTFLRFMEIYEFPVCLKDVVTSLILVIL